MTHSGKVLLGIVVGVHGLRGAVRIKSFTAKPSDIAAYGEVCDESETRRFRIKILGMTRGAVLATISGIADRNAAEAVRGMQLFVNRAALPPTDKNEYYHADLIGLAAERIDGTQAGRVAAVHNHGAGDILEIRAPDGAELLLHFQQQFVPVVDIEGGRIVIDPPADLEAPGTAPSKEATVPVDGAKRPRRRRKHRKPPGEPVPSE